MDHDHHFPTDGLSESERVSALDRLIHEFEALKAKEPGDLSYKQRQMLLALWGDLVLGRKDPDAPPMPEIASDDMQHEHDAPLSEDGIGDGAHVEAHHDPLDAASETEAVDSAHEIDSTHDHPATQAEAVPDPSALYHVATDEKDHEASAHEADGHDADEDMSHDDPEHHPIEDEIDASEVSPDIGDHHHDPVGIDLVKTHDHDPSASISDEPVEHHHDQSLLMIKPVETAQASSVVTLTPSDDSKNSAVSTITSVMSDSSTEATLGKIFDVAAQDNQPLLAIKPVEDREKPLIPIHASLKDHIEEPIPDMVRLRLLKTGVLHDMVLPQGTIVSTFAADAEELIASGTAEKLLIQTESDDDA